MVDGTGNGMGDGGPDARGPIRVEFLHEKPDDMPDDRRPEKVKGKGRPRSAKRAEFSARTKELVFMLVVAVVLGIFFLWVLKDVLYRLIALIGLVAAILYNVRRILLRTDD